jgi:SAM-dependent methyltransferase
MPVRRIWSYGVPASHEAASNIIRRHSTNPSDVREQALGSHDLAHVRNVLDLGCGFGYMVEEIARRSHPDAVITGVDAHASNWRPFVRRVQQAGRIAHFRRMRILSHLPWDDGSFDLVVCSYSLYFFVEVVPEIARVLKDDGRLVALTHSEESVRDMMVLAGVDDDRSALLRLIRRFSAESGEDVLSSHFSAVERTDYPNTLRFEHGELDDLLAYLRFKFRFISDWPESEPELHRLHETEIEERFGASGPVELQKDDAAFWAEVPRRGL